MWLEFYKQDVATGTGKKYITLAKFELIELKCILNILAHSSDVPTRIFTLDRTESYSE
jgi:hypothetical protein